jgi:hypothetical protein
VAAQLYGGFQENAMIGMWSYNAVALNLAASMTAFILMDWKAKKAVKSGFVSERMLNAGHFACMSSIAFELRKNH